MSPLSPPLSPLSRRFPRLMPYLDSLEVYDNSMTAAAGKPAAPVKVLTVTNCRGQLHVNLPDTPEWAKPIVAMAFKIWELNLA